MALLFNTTRTANIIALTACTAWTINRSDFSAIMTSSNKNIYVERSSFLRKIEFLSHLSDYEVAKIAHVARIETFTKGDFIVKESEKGILILPLRSKKAGIFEKLLGIARSHFIVTRGPVSLSCATQPFPLF